MGRSGSIFSTQINDIEAWNADLSTPANTVATGWQLVAPVVSLFPPEQSGNATRLTAILTWESATQITLTPTRIALAFLDNTDSSIETKGNNFGFNNNLTRVVFQFNTHNDLSNFAKVRFTAQAGLVGRPDRCMIIAMYA